MLNLIDLTQGIVTCRLKARVYTENTSDAWHIPRYHTRKHCITSMYRLVWGCIVSYILVLQCFRVGYRGICHASLVFSVYTRAFRRVCIRRKYTWQVACSTVSHEKALHNYFIPCLNVRKTYGNFGKNSEISANFRKLRKQLTKWSSENFGTTYQMKCAI